MKVAPAKSIVKELRRYKGLTDEEELIIGQAKITFNDENKIVMENIETKEVVLYSPAKFLLEVIQTYQKTKSDFKKLEKQKSNKRRHLK